MSFARRFIRRCFSNRFIQFLRGFLQRQTGRGTIHRFTSKFRQIHFDICRHNHQIRCGYFFGGDCITRTNRTTGFNFHPPATFFRFGFNGFSRHKGVCYASRASSHRNYAFRTAGGNRCCRSDRRSVRFRMAFGFTQEQLRVRNCPGNITQPDIFTVQRAVIRDGITENNRHFCVVRIVDDFQFCFSRRRAQQGLRHIGACLTEISVNNQQRFHYASPAVS